MRRRPDIAFLFSYGELRDAFRANREFELACAKQSILSGVRTNHFRLSSSGVEPRLESKQISCSTECGPKRVRRERVSSRQYRNDM